MRKFNIEFTVGLFVVAGILCLGYLSIKLGGMELIGNQGYDVYALFSNSGGLKQGSSVMIAGVEVGRIRSIALDDYQARIVMNLNNDVKVQDDAIAAIKTKGLIGEKFIEITPGGSERIIPPGGRIRETLPPIDFEQLVSKYVFGKDRIGVALVNDRLVAGDIMQRGYAVRVAFITMLVLNWACPVWAGVPTDKVKETTDKILAIVSDPALKEPAKEKQRRERIRRTVDELCDWDEMSRRSLGKHWAQRSEQERKEFVHLFGQLLERTYIDKVEGYSGEKVNYVGERLDGDYAEVDVKIVTKQNTEIPVLYKLRTRDQKWWVYDIVIEGVSLVNNYRTQFNDILAKSSFEGLMKKLREKSAE